MFLDFLLQYVQQYFFIACCSRGRQGGPCGSTPAVTCGAWVVGAARIVAVGGAEAAVAALRAFTASEDVHGCACEALWHMGAEAPGKEAIVIAGG